MHPAIEMFSFPPHKGRADHGFDGKTAPIGQPPLHHHTNQAIDGVVAGTILEVVFQAGMALDGEHRGHLKFAGGQLSAAGGAMGPHRSGQGAGQGNPSWGHQKKRQSQRGWAKQRHG